MLYSIAIPFYNEEKNVEKIVKDLVAELRAKKINYELILVNNGSKDNTPYLLERIKKGTKERRL